MNRARKRRESEIAHHPAISQLIIQNKWVSPVLVSTARCASTQGGKERVVRDRARKQVPGFVKNRERLVDRFHVMIRADIAIAVWRRASAELGCSTPSKVSIGAGIVGVGRQRFLISLCNHGEEEVPVAGGAPVFRVRISRQTSLFGFPSAGNVREVSQILVQTGRADHLHDVRSLCAGSILRRIGPSRFVGLVLCCDSP